MAGEPGPLQMAQRTKAGSALMECGPRVRSGFLAERLLTTGGDRPPDTNEAPSPTPIRRSFYPVPSERGGAEGRSKAESHRAISYLATSTSRTSPLRLQERVYQGQPVHYLPRGPKEATLTKEPLLMAVRLSLPYPCPRAGVTAREGGRGSLPTREPSPIR